MAGEFNPNVPFVEGTPYLQWSREIQQPPSDKSGEIRGKAIGTGLREAGTGLKEGTAGIHAAIETGLKNDVYAQGDEFMNKEISSLYNEYLGYEGIPTEIKNMPNQTATLANARDTGKISDTDHDARMDTLAKSIRAKYPGFRQEVDEHFRAATGRGSTANQLYESIRGDLNAAVAARKEGRNKVEGELWKGVNDGLPGAAERMALYRAGKIDELGVAKWLGDAYAYKYQNALAESRIKQIDLKEKVKKEDADNSEANAQFRIAHKVHDIMTLQTMTIDGTDMTYEQVERHYQEHPELIKSEQAIQARQLIDAQIEKAKQETWAEMHSPNTKGVSLATPIGDKRLKEVLDDGAEPLRLFGEMFYDGKLGAAKAVQETVKSSIEDIKRSNQMDPVIGQTYRQIEAMKDWPNAAQSVLIGAVVGNPNFTGPMIQRMLTATSTMATGPSAANGYIPQPVTGGVTGGTTLASELDKIPRLPPQGVQVLLDSVSLIGNTKVPENTALSLIQAVYGVGAGGVVGKFDPKPNAFGTTDQNEVFKTLTAPRNTKRIHKLGEQYPQVWDNYSAFAEREWYAKSNQDLLDLEQASRDWPDMGIKYNVQSHHFDAHYAGPRLGMGQKEPLQMQSIRQTIKRVNDGLDHMEHIYINNKVDLDAQVVKLLAAHGISTPTIVGHMLDAMESQYSSTSEDDEREGDMPITETKTKEVNKVKK